MNTDFSDSPFAVYADLLLQDHSAARHLGLCVLSLYDGEQWKCRLDCIVHFDPKYLRILFELMHSYHRHGENDPHFLTLGQLLYTRFARTRRKGRARQH